MVEKGLIVDHSVQSAGIYGPRAGGAEARVIGTGCAQLTLA
jgi:hypothetical protein